MDSTSWRKQVIKSLRSDGLVGQQQPERQYEVLTVGEQRLLAVRWPETVLRFITLGDVVVPFWGVGVAMAT